MTELRMRLYKRAIADCPDDFYSKSADDKGAWFTGGKRGILSEDCERFCEGCECLIAIEQGFFFCPDCQLQGKIEALEDHISFIAEFMGGYFGPIDKDEFLKAEAERVEAVNELNKLLKDNEL